METQEIIKTMRLSLLFCGSPPTEIFQNGQICEMKLLSPESLAASTAYTRYSDKLAPFCLKLKVIMLRNFYKKKRNKCPKFKSYEMRTCTVAAVSLSVFDRSLGQHRLRL